jgi:Arabinose efflux permease
MTSERRLVTLYIEYGLMAIGLVSPMIFLADFVARGLHGGSRLGSLMWIVYGAGAILGPPIYGWLSDRLGGSKALRVILLVQALAVGALAVSQAHFVIAGLSLVVGSFPPGIVPPMLAWVRELARTPERQVAIWTCATVVFATAQAFAGFLYSAVFALTGSNHRLLFGIGATALALAWMVNLLATKASREIASS